MSLQDTFGPGPCIILGFVIHGREQLIRLDVVDAGAAEECFENLRTQTEDVTMTESAIRAIEDGQAIGTIIARTLPDGRKLLIASPGIWEHLLTLMERASRTDGCLHCRSVVQGLASIWPMEEVEVSPGLRALRFHKCVTS